MLTMRIEKILDFDKGPDSFHVYLRYDNKENRNWQEHIFSAMIPREALQRMRFNVNNALDDDDFDMASFTLET